MSSTDFKYVVPGFDSPEEVPHQVLADTFVTAVEGACSDWLRTFTLVQGTHSDPIWYSCPDLYSKPFQIKVLPTDRELGRTVNNLDVQQALALMAQEFPEDYHILLNEDGDAKTADIFLQLVVFKKVIYG